LLSALADAVTAHVHAWRGETEATTVALAGSRALGTSTRMDIIVWQRWSAGLAAGRHWNAYIHRTVGSHLYRIYAKLGIGARTALRDAIADLAWSTPVVRCGQMIEPHAPVLRRTDGLRSGLPAGRAGTTTLRHACRRRGASPAGAGCEADRGYGGHVPEFVRRR
jgi:hypothetical protein